MEFLSLYHSQVWKINGIVISYQGHCIKNLKMVGCDILHIHRSINNQSVAKLGPQHQSQRWRLSPFRRQSRIRQSPVEVSRLLAQWDCSRWTLSRLPSRFAQWCHGVPACHGDLTLPSVLLFAGEFIAHVICIYICVISINSAGGESTT